ncbi:MAG: globin [Gammaproteobacteria bacterium]|nr:globin [Gammaproteobacteria bacterium]
MVEKSTVARVHNSFGRCLLGDRFFDRFYEIFLASNDEVPKRFAKTDFKKQKELLRHGLGTVLNYATGSNAMANHAVARLKTSHGKENLNIPPALYASWIDSLVKTVSECDPEFTEQLREDWQEVVMPAIKEMVSGYSK